LIAIYVPFSALSNEISAVEDLPNSALISDIDNCPDAGSVIKLFIKG
jgi:hypothetical protein